MEHPKIIVFGATGNNGFETAKALANKGIPFRAAVRDVKKGDKIKELGKNIELVEVDIFDAKSLEKALDGMEKVFMLLANALTTSGGNALIDAIEKNGKIKHIVKLSALGTEETGGKFILAEEHRPAEDRINSLGIGLTSLRPSGFFSNEPRDFAHSVKNDSAIYTCLAKTKQNRISNEDIGEVAATVLADKGTKHYGKIYYLTGPENYTGEEEAQILSSVVGRDIKCVPLTVDEFKQRISSYFPPEAADKMANMMKYFIGGGYDRKYDGVEEVLGRKPKSFPEYVAANKSAFM